MPDIESNPPDFSDVESGGSSTAPRATPQSQSQGQIYTVKPGDSLRKIAQHFYGDEMQWHRIRDANRDKLPNPDKIQIGMQLTIPNA
jgi:nucleoid-associated protein YgaU